MVALSLSLLGLGLLSSVATAACPDRVRKSWDALSTPEKTLYKSAIQTAMDAGAYERFLSMHREEMSNMEAHNTCVFMYWHRQFLVGFENMLRSLSPEYACVTLPYFDYVNHNAKYTTRQCKSIAECSPILGQLGSFASGSRMTVKIGDYDIYGRCDATPPLDHYCQHPATTPTAKKACAKCVPRGDYTRLQYPTELGFTGVKDDLFSGPDVASVNSAIEANPHNNVHNVLQGAMGNPFVSPSDPIFYSHHTTIDALNTIFYKCRAKGVVKASERATSRLSFEGCVVNGAPITANSSITMNVIHANGTSINVRHPGSGVSQYFHDVPTSYYQLTDNTDLGTNSYSYQFAGVMADLYTNCSLAGGLTTKTNLRQLADEIDVPMTPRDANGDLQNFVTAKHDTAVDAYMSWRTDLVAAGRDALFSDDKIEAEIYKVVVMYYSKCLPGGVVDLKPQFKSLWRVQTTSKQVQVLNAILDGSAPI
ncbi:hypothetical protein SDRG_17332, partial [Saprolegnia diclina VS20]